MRAPTIVQRGMAQQYWFPWHWKADSPRALFSGTGKQRMPLRPGKERCAFGKCLCRYPGSKDIADAHGSKDGMYAVKQKTGGARNGASPAMLTDRRGDQYSSSLKKKSSFVG